MIDPFALLACVFGVGFVIMLCALLAMADSHRRWRELAENSVADYQIAVKDFGDLADEYAVAINRNTALETQRVQLKAILGAAMMFEPCYRAREQRVFAVREAQEAP